MNSDHQSQTTEAVRKVLLTLKNKSGTLYPIKYKHKENAGSQSDEEDVENEQVIQIKNEQTWGNHLEGVEWINEQKKNNQFRIVDQREFINFSPKQYRAVFLQITPAGSQLQHSKLFVDKVFPATKQSITGEWGFVAKYESVYWERASKKIPEFHLFQDKVSPNSLIQGKLGDCYFLAAVAALAQRPDRIFKLFLTTQSGPERRFAVKILYKGKWKIIELDQLFAFEKDKLVFSRSSRNELWVMLVEKAWAKLYKSYMNISSGHAQQCLHDFTGAPITFFNLKSKDFNQLQFWQYLIKASKRQYAMCASSNPGFDTKMSDTGIVQGHAYTLLNAVNLTFEGKQVKLLQLRNPWGRGQGRGDWSDLDPRWKKVSQQQKDELQYQKNKKDGIFFIDLQDFLRQYRAVVVAQINDNASYVYQSCRDPHSEGVLFKLKIVETARYSLQVDKTPKRAFAIKKRINYKYPVAEIKLYDYSGKQINNYSDSERLTCCKHTLKKGQYFTFVLIHFDKAFETDFDVTLAVYAEHSCFIELASPSDRRKIGANNLSSSKQLKKKKFQSAPKANNSSQMQKTSSSPNIKLYANPTIQNIPRPSVHIKQKLSVVTKSRHSKQLPYKQQQSQNTNNKQVRSNNEVTNLINKIILNGIVQIIDGQKLDLASKLDNQIIFIEESPAKNKLANLMIGKKDFLDDRFQANLASLTGQWGFIPQWKNVRWERLSKTMPNAPIFAQNISPNSIRQGFLGDCYFLATLAALAEKPSRILNLFLLTQKNEINYYSVKMLFRGKWLTIDMDDYIPYTYDIPAFSYTVQNELWVMLLEKAWAKMYSSYKRIEAGFPEEALHDLTAAPIRHIFLQKPQFKPQQQWVYLMRATELQYSMVASSQVGSDNLKSVSGIVQGHAYTLLKVVEVKVNGQIRRLVQLRNPWGKGEGRQQWSDDSKNWDLIDSQQKKRIGYENKEDGIFFIGYELFYKEFKLITIAQIHDNASYVYQSCEDSKLQGCYFTVKILKQGRYSWQIDNTPQRSFENHYHTDYRYPQISFQLGVITEQGYVRRMVQLSSNSRTLYHPNVVPPGVYVCYVKINFDVKFEKVFDINLAIYGDFPCDLRLSDKKQAVMFSNNPNINWPPQKKTLSTQKAAEWNGLKSYNTSNRKSKY